ncbi:hypothetical protein ABZ635_20720 [Nocardiopsis sp. NPDC007018]|uniref:hypothetical protein n=1 Tax=Nocardiopsis sp. NPDC007018 TaxID=3155721 RepID=UPI0033F661BE
MPAMVASSTIQRADTDLLLALDLTGARARVRAAWDGGPRVTVVCEPDTDADRLRHLLEGAAPGRTVRASPPGHGREFWAPPTNASARARYAWLLDQICVDSTHWRMRDLNLVAVHADPATGSADLTLERLDGVGTVTARVPLLAGEELVGAPDWIAGRVRTTLAQGSGGALVVLPG